MTERMSLSFHSSKRMIARMNAKSRGELDAPEKVVGRNMTVRL